MQTSIQRLLVKLIFFLPLCPAAFAFTWWIDSTSCAPYPDLSSSVYEAVSIANGATEFLLADLLFTDDNLLESYFQTIFKAPRSNDPTFQSVLTVLGGIAKLTPAATQGESNIRIYCDEDAWVDPDIPATHGNRWSIVPDIETAGPTPNSERTKGEDQEWQDITNQVRMHVKTQGCATPDIPINAEMQFLRPSILPLDTATITVCNAALKQSPKLFTFLQDLPAERDFSDEYVDIFQNGISFILLHEFTHFPQYRPRSGVPGLEVIDFGYGWDEIQKLTNDQAVYNADSYAYFGLLLYLRQRHFRLSNNAQDALQGFLEFDNTI